MRYKVVNTFDNPAPDMEHETRTSKRRLEEGSEETESRCGPHKKASEAKSLHAEENDLKSSTQYQKLK